MFGFLSGNAPEEDDELEYVVRETARSVESNTGGTDKVPVTELDQERDLLRDKKGKVAQLITSLWEKL